MSKFYIQIVLFLLSISVCLNNTTLAADPSPKKASQKVLNKSPNNVPNKAPNKSPNNVPNKSPNNVPNKAPNNVPNKSPNNVPNKTPNNVPNKAPNNVPNKAPNNVPNEIPGFISENPYPTPEEIFEEKKQLLCEDPEETINAAKLMDEAVVHLAYHAANKDGSEPSKSNTGSSSLSHKKEDENTTKILKANRKIYHLYMYNNIVNMIWNPHPVKFYINESVISGKENITRKIVRVYDPNLIMIQQRYKKGSKGGQKYFYALVKKAHLSEDKTIIVMTSVNMKDQDSSNEKHKNTIIENANLFKTSIESEGDIKNGELKKVLVNIAGYLIEKIKNDIHITYIESINEEDSTDKNA
ncbi:fam-a protein [Plasmodium vinckei petteri]|uniref:Fam-a protein n=1 Tax=Plasmodium vinckei petteri TaxID=138298 RepID=A0A6V7SC38_PLAVN|nr:fam-a protein [Plasmodium vinckei petteri]